MKKPPIKNVMTNQRRRPLTSPRSAANTPHWQVTDDRTRTVVLTAANGRSRWLVASCQTAGPWTARIVKYIAKRAAKNISSEESQTMVPTPTTLGRLAGPPCGVAAGADAVAVATGCILPGPAPASDPDPPD